MEKNTHPLIKGTLLLTAAGLASRIIGFYYKIFLVSLIGAEGIGIYQMVFPTYMLCLALASSGIQTAISRFTAEKISTGHPGEARRLFLAGLSMALAAALLLAALLFLCAQPLSLHVLGDPRCLPLIRLMALSIPFETLHTCACGYFLGQQKTGFPALTQLLEQLVRVLATFLLYRILLQSGIAPTPKLAAAGLLIAEMAAAFATISFLSFQKPPKQQTAKSYAPSPLRESLGRDCRAILSVALPLSSNRLMLNLLHSLEAIIVPLRLQLYYQNSATALATYGIFSGMAMPLILLPCSLTGSFSMVLLPSVSEAHALKNDKKIAATIQSSLLLCFFLGVTCTAAFLFFGSDAGNLLYHNELVGSYLITLAWICPFLYLTTVSGSILHGLGKTMEVFFHNLAGQILRLLFSWFLLPYLGIRGCLWGLLASELTTALLSLRALRRCVSFDFRPGTLILFPCGCVLGATGFLKVLWHLLPLLQRTDLPLPFLLSAGIWGLTVLLLYGWLGKKLRLVYGQSH